MGLFVNLSYLFKGDNIQISAQSKKLSELMLMFRSLHKQIRREIKEIKAVSSECFLLELLMFSELSWKRDFN